MAAPGGQVPQGWELLESKASGKRYWFNKLTGQATWDHPSSLQAPIPVPTKAVEPEGQRPCIHLLTRLPLRPGAEVCSQWTTSGHCDLKGFCPLDHPPSATPERMMSKYPLAEDTMPAGMAQTGGLPEYPAAEDCPFFAKYSMCKFGKSCTLRHPKDRQTPKACLVNMDGQNPPRRQIKPPPAKHAATAAAQTPAKLASTWTAMTSPEGYTYYYNTVTGKSQWEMPPEMSAATGQPAANHSFPVRPGFPDCAFFLQTGVCKFGTNCKFNHPPDGKPSNSSTVVAEQLPVRPGEPDCEFYMATGECKFGSKCLYNHPPGAVKGPPIRPGAKDCAFYLKTGVCSFGQNCKFNHPPLDLTHLDKVKPQQSMLGGTAAPDTTR